MRTNVFDSAGRPTTTIDAADWQIDRTYTDDGLVAHQAGTDLARALLESQVDTTYDHAGQPM